MLAAVLGGVAVVGVQAAPFGRPQALPDRYLVETYNPTINVTKRGAKVEAIEIVDGRGRVVRRIEQGRFGIGAAGFSPDGKVIAWIDPQGLNVENANGSGRRLLVPASKHCKLECIGLSYAWSPDSATIIVGGAGTLTNALVALDVKTGATRQLAPLVHFTEYQVIGYSPDGSQIAVEIESGDPGTASCCKSLLAVENPDGTGQRILFSFSDAIHDGAGDASWSPDGSKLAFTDDGRDPHDPRFGITDVHAATTRSISGLSTADDRPIWSPDGNQLTAVTYRERPLTYSVNVVDLASGTPKRIGLGVVPIAWYSDGTILTTGGEKNNVLYRLNAAGGTQQRIFTLPNPLQLLAVTPLPQR